MTRLAQTPGLSEYQTDILAAVGRLTGDDDPTTVNQAFPGWWTGHTPG